MTPPTQVRRAVADVRRLHGRPLDLHRLLLTADLLGRTLDHVHGGRLDLVVLVDEAGGRGGGGGVDEGGGGGDDKPQEARHDPLHFARSPRVSSPEQAVAVLGGRPDVVLEPVDRDPTSRVDHTPDAWILAVAATRAATTEATSTAAQGTLDPCVLRLALLRFRHQQPAALSMARLHRAEETLRRWRLKVADWADMPRALPLRSDLDALRHALLDDLDTPTVLVLLHRLEMDARAPSGRKFETFAAIDRLLGLDLCHLVRSAPFVDDVGLGHDGGTAMGLAVETWPPKPLTVPDT